MKSKEEKFIYTEEKILEVSNFLQSYMEIHHVNAMTADECASALAKEHILVNDLGPKPGFNFRELLRQCRDGNFKNQVEGAYQRKPKARWSINYYFPKNLSMRANGLNS